MRVQSVNLLRVPFLREIQCNYSPTVALYTSQKLALSGNNVVDRVKVEDDLSQAQPDKLRWKVVSNTSSKALPMSTQRNRLRRRWAAAFEESLKRHGLDRHGKRHVSQTHMPHTPEVSGTLEMLVHNGYGFNEPSEELANSMDRVVEVMLQKATGIRRVTSQNQNYGDKEPRWNRR